MTKRETQAREYAAESYEKRHAKQGIPHMSDLISDAISRFAEQDATLSVCEGNVTVTMDATLTDSERDAVRFFATYGAPAHRANTLRKLLERLK